MEDNIYRYGKILRANMVSRNGRNKKAYGKVIESEYGFTYWKKLNTGAGSLPYGKKLKTGMGRYWERIWFPVLEEIKYGWGKIYYNGYRFPYWKKLKTGTGRYYTMSTVSRTGRN